MIIGKVCRRFAAGRKAAANAAGKCKKQTKAPKRSVFKRYASAYGCFSAQ
jgi:hypothetical protein